MKPTVKEVAIPTDVVHKWQRIVDLLASIVHVPSAVVCKLEPPHDERYKILASSVGDANPFPVDDTFSMDIGTFCETVIKSRAPLLVINGLEDAQWKQAPEMQVGMVSYLGFPVFWPDGRVCGTICVLDNKANAYSDLYQQLLVHCRDVLQADLQTLVRLSDELEDQKAHLSELFARVPEAVVLISSDSTIARVNPEFTRLFGYSPDDALGHGINDLIAPDELRPNAEACLEQLFGTDVPFVVDTVRARKDGTRVPVSLICIPVPFSDGRRAGYLIHRDMTAARRLEEEQRRYQDIQIELAHANRVATLGELSAAIAHELNQPLTGIMTNSATCLRMLTSTPQDLEGAQEAVKRTMRDSTRASSVVMRLRALFSQKAPACETVDLSEAAREVVALSLEDVQNSRVTLQTQFAADLPNISADRIQLQQVVLNLVRNALDAMSTIEDRHRELVVSTDRENDDFVRFSVRDSGVGFDPAKANKLFGAFFSTKTTGMGVGLAVSRSIIESHHGRIWATLNEGPGATFSFAVPIYASRDV